MVNCHEEGGLRLQEVSRRHSFGWTLPDGIPWLVNNEEHRSQRVAVHPWTCSFYLCKPCIGCSVVLVYGYNHLVCAEEHIPWTQSFVGGIATLAADLGHLSGNGNHRCHSFLGDLLREVSDSHCSCSPLAWISHWVVGGSSCLFVCDFCVLGSFGRQTPLGL